MDFFKDLYELVESPDVFEELVKSSLLSDDDGDDLDSILSTKPAGNTPTLVVPAAPATPTTKVVPSTNPTPPTTAPAAPATPATTAPAAPAKPVRSRRAAANSNPATKVVPSTNPTPPTTAPAAPATPPTTAPAAPATPPTTVWSDKEQYYYDNLKLGDKVHFNAYYSDDPSNPIKSVAEVVGLNPNGDRHILVRPVSGDPTAEPISLNYSEIMNLERSHAYDEKHQKTETDALPELQNTFDKKDSASIANIINSAGATYGLTEKGKVYFYIPNSEELFNLPMHKVSPEAIQEIIEKNTPKKEFGEADHWKNKLPSNLIKKISLLLVDIMKYGEKLPSNIIAAKNRLLHPTNDEQYLESAAEIQDFLKDPIDFLKEKSPKNKDFFKNNHGLDVDTPSSLDRAPQELSGYSQPIKSQFFINGQENAANEMVKIAEENGLSDLALKIKIDQNKDNVDLLHFYKSYLDNSLKKIGVNPPKINIPSSHQGNLFEHLDDLTSRMNEYGLNHPHYESLIEKLNFLIEKDPKNQKIDEMFEELNNYIHKNGKNDAHEQLFALQNDLNNGLMDSLESGEKKEVEDLIKKYGNTEPSRVVSEISKILNKYGEYVPDFFEGQDRDLQALNYINGNFEGNKPLGVDTPKKDEDSPPNGMKWVYRSGIRLLEPDYGSKYSDKLNSSKTEELLENEKTLPHVAKEPTLRQQKNKKLNKYAEEIKRQEIVLEQLLGDPVGKKKFDKDPMSQLVKKRYIEAVHNYNALGQELSDEDGSTFQPIKSMFDKEDEGVSQYTKDLYDDLYRQSTETQKNEISFLRNTVKNSEHTIGLYRRHFLQSLDQYNPDVKDDLKTIDEYVGNNIKDRVWKPIPEKLAKTEIGNKFLQQINQQIDRVVGAHKATNVAIDEIYKSSLSDIEAEKILSKRDFGIAVKKSFGEKDFKFISEQFEPYIDRVVEDIMNAFPNLPIKIRKSINRYYMKCINNDVIKNNNDIELNKSLKMIYTENGLTSMIKKFSLISTDIKSLNKPIFYIDLDQVQDIPHKKPVMIEFENKNLSKSEWFSKFKNIQDIMVKGDVLEYELPENRLKKFINNNDNRVVSDFYNKQVEIVKKWLI